MSIDCLLLGKRKKLWSFLRLVGILCLLPAILAFLHLYYRHRDLHRDIYRDSIRLILIEGGKESLLGLFTREIGSLSVYKALDFSYLIEGSWGHHVTDLTQQSDLLLGKSQRKWHGNHPLLKFSQNVSLQWCFSWENQKDTGVTLCQRQIQKNTVLGEYFETGKAIDDSAAAHLSVQKLQTEVRDAPTAKSWLFRSRTAHTSFRTNPDKRIQRDQPSPLYEALVIQPVTSLLIILQAAIAYLYWSEGTQVTSVAQIYDRIAAHPFEPWRLLSGATAHFEIWHLGFNMMSLSALGQQLEISYGSIVFLAHNISLIFWTGTLWLIMQRAVIYYRRRRNPSFTPLSIPTVGYSGVLFAWITIVALEHRISCPIFFFPDLCFHAFTFGGFQFNWGPLVQLVFLQAVLPRVSWTGHLAGVVAGFIVHWHVLPPILMVPSVVIPFLHCIYLVAVRRISFHFSTWSEDIDKAATDDSAIWALYSVGFLLSTVALGPLCSLSISYIFLVLLAFQLRITAGGAERQTALMRVLIVTAVIVQVTDSLTVGSWAVSFKSIQPKDYLPAVFACSTLFFRACCSLYTLVRLSGRLASETGIFGILLQRTVLTPCTELGSTKSTLLVDTPWSTQGHRLGSSEGPSDSRRLSRLV